MKKPFRGEGGGRWERRFLIARLNCHMGREREREPFWVGAKSQFLSLSLDVGICILLVSFVAKSTVEDVLSFAQGKVNLFPRTRGRRR